VYSASSARNLYFRATGASADIIPQRINNGTHGFAVRCVRQ
jgi:hypothetical protein